MATNNDGGFMENNKFIALGDPYHDPPRDKVHESRGKRQFQTCNLKVNCFCVYACAMQQFLPKLAQVHVHAITSNIIRERLGDIGGKLALTLDHLCVSEYIK